MSVGSQSIDRKILRSIQTRKGASAFSAKDFGNLGSRSVVGQGLARLMKQGDCGESGRASTICEEALAARADGAGPAGGDSGVDGGERRSMAGVGRVGGQFAGAVGAGAAKIVILTNGVPRCVVLGRLTLTFRRAAPRNLLGAGQPAGLVIQAIRHLRKNGCRRR